MKFLDNFDAHIRLFVVWDGLIRRDWVLLIHCVDTEKIEKYPVQVYVNSIARKMDDSMWKSTL